VGSEKNPSLPALRKIAKVLGVPVTEWSDRAKRRRARSAADFRTGSRFRNRRGEAMGAISVIVTTIALINKANSASNFSSLTMWRSLR